MSNGSDGKKLSSSLLVTLGLAGMVTSAVSCGPCLNYAFPDTGDTGDTGDPGDSGDTEEDAHSGDRDAARRRVLSRGVLPEDVAKILRKAPKS